MNSNNVGEEFNEQTWLYCADPEEKKLKFNILEFLDTRSSRSSTSSALNVTFNSNAPEIDLKNYEKSVLNVNQLKATGLKDEQEIPSSHIHKEPFRHNEQLLGGKQNETFTFDGIDVNCTLLEDIKISFERLDISLDTSLISNFQKGENVENMGLCNKRNFTISSPISPVIRNRRHSCVNSHDRTTEIYPENCIEESDNACNDTFVICLSPIEKEVLKTKLVKAASQNSLLREEESAIGNVIVDSTSTSNLVSNSNHSGKQNSHNLACGMVSLSEGNIAECEEIPYNIKKRTNINRRLANINSSGFHSSEGALSAHAMPNINETCNKIYEFPENVEVGISEGSRRETFNVTACNPTIKKEIEVGKKLGSRLPVYRGTVTKNTKTFSKETIRTNKTK